jgi:phage/plasmid-associated DNA primase
LSTCLEAKAQRLHILFGDGNKGKTTFLEAIRYCFGEYTGQVPIQSLMKKRGDDGVPNDIAQLSGKRFVTSSENESKQKLAVAKIKDLSGLGKIQARFL